MTQSAAQTPLDGLPVVRGAIAVIWRGVRVLVGRRPESVYLAGFREFPGGKTDPGETPAECAVREAREEAGVDVRVTGSRGVLDYAYPDRRVVLHVFDAEIVAGAPGPPFVWMHPDELRDADFPPATAPLLEQLRQGR